MLVVLVKTGHSCVGVPSAGTGRGVETSSIGMSYVLPMSHLCGGPDCLMVSWLGVVPLVGVCGL